MLVLMGPSFAGGEEAFRRLGQLTGMLPYDLKARVKPGSWGLLRVLADAEEALRLGASLQEHGFPVVVLSREVATDPARRIVAVHGLDLGDEQFTLLLREREMVIPYGALACIVRGEAQLGKAAGRTAERSVSSSTFRAVVPDASDVQVFREASPAAPFEAFAAADLHFHSVPWIGRIDARGFDFARYGIEAATPAAALDALVEQLGQRAAVRIDRSARSSSVASFAEQAARGHSHPPASTPHRGRDIAGDERFDPYSRLIGEGERSLSRAASELG